MEKVTLAGSANIAKVYERLRKIDSAKDGKMDNAISQEELDEARKQGIDTTVDFKEGKASSLDALQRLYIKLQQLDAGDGAKDGDVKELKEHLGVPWTAEQLENVALPLDIDALDISPEKRKAVLDMVKGNGKALEQVDGVLRKDKEIVLAAVKQYGWALLYANETFRKDKEVVLAAVKQAGPALQYADESLKRDKEIVLVAVKQSGYALQYADESLKRDKEIVLAAVEQDGPALQYADELLKQDRGFILITVKQDGSVLGWADKSLQKDREVVLAAVYCCREKGWLARAALLDADESLRKDKDFMLAAINLAPSALECADESLKKDKEVVLAAVKQGGWALQYADESLKKDRDFILTAVKQAGTALEYADLPLKKDREIVLAAIKQDRRALRFADESFKIENNNARQTAEKYLDEIGRRDTAQLLKDCATIIPQLLNTFQTTTIRRNSWHYSEEYYVPFYAAANIIGEIALLARKTNNTKALDLINRTATPIIEELLRFETDDIDYGHVYVIYDMKKALLDVLTKIGNPDVIPTIKECNDNNYTSPYNGWNVSIAKFKRDAVEYLERQKQSKEFIDPFPKK